MFHITDSTLPPGTLSRVNTLMCILETLGANSGEAEAFVIIIIIIIIINCKWVYTRWQCAAMQGRTLQYNTVQYNIVQLHMSHKITYSTHNTGDTRYRF